MIKAETICKAERIILSPVHVATAAVSKASTKMIGTYCVATKLEWRFIVRSLGVLISNPLKSVLTGYYLQELTLQKSEVVVMLWVHDVQGREETAMEVGKNVQAGTLRCFLMRPNKRDELVRKAMEVFYRDGFHATGMDKLVVETGVSKTSMYKHFRTKEDLILAVLRLRDESFRNRILRRVEQIADTPAGQLIATFDAFKEWFEEDDFRGCMFLKAAAEYQDASHPIHVQAAEHKRVMLEHLTSLARQSGAHAPELLARQIVLLQEGAIVSAVLLKNGNPAEDAKVAAQLLLDAELTRKNAALH